jgi:glycosyltransferase involved in cell wall biosynthesis
VLNLLYVTYDGALDPLGATQVVPYLCALAERGVRVTLISFDKHETFADDTQRRALAERLGRRRITWRALRYHKRPRVPATAWDVARGALEVRAALRGMAVMAPEAARGPVLVHCRGDVAACVARLARLPSRARLVYEVRGLFSDERVEVGSWRAGSLLDRAVRRIERANLRRADGLLAVMAAPGLEALRRERGPLPPHRLLPNSVDLATFTPRARAERADYGLVYHGSLGGWYLTREMVDFARVARHAVPGRVLFLTPQVEAARAAGADPDWAEVRAAAPGAVPDILRRARAAFFLIRPTPAKRASSPTKFAEALACGLPVAANGAAGGLDTLLESERVGALVERCDEDAYRDAARRLRALLDDPETGARCRRLAEARYSLDAAVGAYLDLYRELATDSALA